MGKWGRALLSSELHDWACQPQIQHCRFSTEIELSARGKIKTVTREKLSVTTQLARLFKLPRVLICPPPRNNPGISRLVSSSDLTREM